MQSNIYLVLQNTIFLYRYLDYVVFIATQIENLRYRVLFDNIVEYNYIEIGGHI